MASARRILASTLIVMMSVFAPAAAQQTPGLQISVEPLIVEFKLAPGGQASTRVTLKNVGSEAAVVTISPIDWYTTVDGALRTSRPGSQGSASLDGYLRLTAQETRLAPGATQQMTLSLALPSTFAPAPRDYWGGYLVRAASADAAGAKGFGVGANILVYETVGAMSRHLKLTALHVVDAGNGNIKVTARMLNDGNNFVRPQITLQLAQASRIVQTREDGTPAIFAGAARSYVRTFSGLARGAYVLTISVDYGGETLAQGTTEFTVK